ncbi:MAG: LutB/LldF family L-lactate oxidation iron-sulfur protein [Verrucomicrobiota bacterium]
MMTIAKTFKESATRYCADLRHRNLIRKALTGYEGKRDENKARFQDWEQARQAAAEIKYEVINHLDKYLDQFAKNIEARGGKVFWAKDAKAAREYIIEVARNNHVKAIIKSKSMTTEEIHLNDGLQQAGFGVFESDLGEFIVQLRDEPPYHLVFPAMHLTRGEISEIFQKKLGAEPVQDPEALTMIARRIMRQKFCEADMGISGVNFGVAETGMISITENEGNARLSTSLPRVHVALMGIEKVIRRMDDLALFLPMLATVGAGQHLTGYNTLYGGPRQADECDGPREFHLVLLDNGRSQMMADPEQRDSLHCIRCGACLNVCPIFRNVGGHSYGTTYQGPIGSVITPNMRGLKDWKHLSFASSLCGACSEACPVKIDLAHHLLQNRRNAVKENPPLLDKLMFSGFKVMMRSPALYRFGMAMGKLMQPLHPIVKGSVLDPVRAWTRTRETPKFAPTSFRNWWKNRSAK